MRSNSKGGNRGMQYQTQIHMYTTGHSRYNKKKLSYTYMHQRQQFRTPLACAVAIVAMTGGIMLVASTLWSAGDALIVDDVEQEYQQEGEEWTVVRKGYSGQESAGRRGRNYPVAAWTFFGLERGVYDLYATWETIDPGSIGRGLKLDTRARFRIISGRRATTVSINQAVPPTSEQGPWQSLGSHSVVGDLKVRLVPSGARRVILADALMLIPRAASASPGFPAGFHAPAPTPVTESLPVSATTPAAPGNTMQPGVSAVHGSPGTPVRTSSGSSLPATGSSARVPLPGPAPTPIWTSPATTPVASPIPPDPSPASSTGGTVPSLPRTSPVCTDSDGGQNTSVKGAVLDPVGLFEDACGNPITLWEWSCQNGTRLQTTHVCACSNDACTGPAPSTCFDSDGGVNTAVRGEAATARSQASDSCMNRVTLNEVFCENGVILSSQHSCACSNGACTGPVLPSTGTGASLGG